MFRGVEWVTLNMSSEDKDYLFLAQTLGSRLIPQDTDHNRPDLSV